MKLIIQIPCYNEEKNLEQTIKELPTKMGGIEKIEYLVISDGSTDKTVEIAKKMKVHHILDIKTNQGLAKTFIRGIEKSLELGADIIVNTDGDNQYSGKDIEKLVKPIIEGRADIVIGQREINKFSCGKRFFQRLGSLVVRKLSNTKVADAPSGFRAYSRESAIKINVYNRFTYTLETIIQAGSSNERVESIKIHSNPDTRKSRLFNNIYEYIVKSIINMAKAFCIYRPVKTFFILGDIFLILGIIMIAIQPSVAIGLIVIAIICYLFMINATIEDTNRKLLEDIQYRLRKMKYEKK